MSAISNFIISSLLLLTDLVCFSSATPPPIGEEFEQYGIRCKFGRFGTSPATYVNKTTMLCLTPNIKENYSSISTESVDVTVAMNGVDFTDDSEVSITFIGSGESTDTWIIIMGITIFSLLIAAIIVMVFGL